MGGFKMAVGALGLQNTLMTRVLGPLNEYRGTDAKPGKEISIEDFLQKKAINENGEAKGLKNADGTPLTLGGLIYDLTNMKPMEVTLGHLLSLTGDVKYLAPEIVRDFIVRGMGVSANFSDLIMGTENVNSLDVTTPWIDYGNPSMETVREGETIPDSGYTWGSKSVRLHKTGIAIKLTDELILSVKLPVLQRWLQRVGVEMSAKLYNNAVTILKTGDQADSSDIASVIGTTTGSSLTFADMVTIWTRANLIGANWGSIVTSEVMANYLLNITEFKPTVGGLGGSVVNINSRNRIIPSNLNHFVSAALGDDEMLMFDSAQALLYLIFRPLLVESERIVSRQVGGTYCSIMSGFTTVTREARILVDKGETYASHGFPSWMVPLT
jgi:hypothetical protein